MDNETPTFETPPIVELVLGVQFNQLRRMQSAHYGRFWDAIGTDWLNPRDNPPIQEQFEFFGRERGVTRLQIEPGPPLNRLTLINQSKDRLVQLQPTRMHLNWRNQESSYPSYKTLIVEFEEILNSFTVYCQSEGLGKAEFNQWEITYVDRFVRGKYWDTPADWSTFLPGLFQPGEIPMNSKLIMENRSVDWSFEIQPKLGRLHVQASLVRGNSDSEDALMLNITARGPLGSEQIQTYRQGLDLGHDVAVDQFLQLVSTETRKSWGEGEHV